MIKKNSLIYLSCFFVLLLPAISLAALVVKTELVSGKIAQLHNDRSVSLSNGLVYKPSRKGLTIDLQKGTPVTLRYYVDNSGARIFFEYAAGEGSLAPMPSYSPSADDLRPK